MIFKKNEIKSAQRTPHLLSLMNPLSRNPGSAPEQLNFAKPYGNNLRIRKLTTKHDTIHIKSGQICISADIVRFYRQDRKIKRFHLRRLHELLQGRGWAHRYFNSRKNRTQLYHLQGDDQIRGVKIVVHIGGPGFTFAV